MKASKRSRNGYIKTQRSYFFTAAALICYVKEGSLKQRHMSAIFESDGPAVTAKQLEQLNRSWLQRLLAENNVPHEDARDIVLLNVAPLGHMTPEEFAGKEPMSTAPLTASTPFDGSA